MRNTLTLLLTVIVLFSCNNEAKYKADSKQELIKRVFEVAEFQTQELIKIVGDKEPLLNPRSLNPDGTIRMAYKADWTSGFFPGTLWYMYEYTKKDSWKVEAEKFTEALDSAQFIKWHHDLGFMIQDSYGHGYRLTGNEEYKQAVIDGAKSLSTRFREKSGIIQSWDADAPWIAGRNWQTPVIIDNMMNLNLLYKGTEFTGDKKFAEIADSHASTTMKYAYRADNSCFHLVDYDSINGAMRFQGNFQGHSDPSAWARGQAWGLYGYTEAFRESGNEEFLKQAQAIAKYIMTTDKIPADKIPYWDYDAEGVTDGTAPRDASAAAIVASALIDLAEYLKDESMLKYAEDILRVLSSKEYLAEKGTNGGFILKHSVGNFHENNENDTAINYADYYFIEALIKWYNI